MGLTVKLEDENGNAIQTLMTEFEYEEFENIDDSKYLLFKYIDNYGDTTFNCLQIEDLIIDLEKLKSTSSRQKEVIEEIIALAKTSKERVHTYLKFYGD